MITIKQHVGEYAADADAEGFVQSEHADDLCSACGAQADASRPLRACGGCNVVQYCSVSCQTRHWSQMRDEQHNHAHHCSLLALVDAAIEADVDVTASAIDAEQLAALRLDAASTAEYMMSAPPDDDDGDDDDDDDEDYAKQTRIAAWLWDDFTEQWYWAPPRRRAGRRSREPIYWTLWGWRPWWWRPWVFVGRGRSRVRRRRQRRGGAAARRGRGGPGPPRRGRSARRARRRPSRSATPRGRGRRE